MIGVPAQQVGQLLLAGLPFALDVLDHEDAKAIAQGAKDQPEGTGGLALAVAGDDHDEAVTSGHGKFSPTRGLPASVVVTLRVTTVLARSVRSTLTLGFQ